ncbi:MAG: LysM peptidoglycan-binding domain-containing protein [Phycisphaerales bacterium]
MTREHKLALIIGFSLILLVAILISDHLSRARSTRVDEVRPTETLLADGVRAMVEPLAPVGGPEPAAPDAPVIRDPMRGPAPVRDAGVLEATQTLAAGPPITAPVSPAAAPRPEPQGHAGLRQQIAAAGGTIEPGPIPLIVLPQTGQGGPASPPMAEGPKVTLPLPPVEEAPRFHAVQKGETLYKIAEKYYGSGSAWKRLADHNKGLIGANGAVREGVRIVIPAGGTMARKSGPAPAGSAPPARTPTTDTRKPKAMPARPTEVRIASGATRATTYTVRKDDTLGDISKKVLGTSRRWREILDLNGLDEDEFLTPGTVLKVPGT